MPAVYRKRRFVAISPSTADALVAIGVDRERIDVIECGVDIPPGPVPQKSAEPLFVSLNRLVPHKRIDLLLDAWERAGAAIPGRLIVAGDGPELEAVRRQASSIPKVEVVGRVSDQQKLELLGRAWAVLSTSHHEGWGLSMIEAATWAPQRWRSTPRASGTPSSTGRPGSWSGPQSRSSSGRSPRRWSAS